MKQRTQGFFIVMLSLAIWLYNTDPVSGPQVVPITMAAICGMVYGCVLLVSQGGG